MKIEVATIAGPNCITAEDGESVFEKVVAGLATPDVVELDFTGVEVYSSPFFNAAIGPLLRDFSPDQLNQRLILLGLSSDGKAVLRRVIKNAREYYTRDSVRALVDAGDSAANRA